MPANDHQQIRETLLELLGSVEYASMVNRILLARPPRIVRELQMRRVAEHVRPLHEAELRPIFSICPLHGEKLKVGWSRLVPGMLATPAHAGYPLAQEYVPGGCVIIDPAPRNYAVAYCDSCREVSAAERERGGGSGGPAII